MKKEENKTIPHNDSYNSNQLDSNKKLSIEKAKSNRLIKIDNKNLFSKETQNSNHADNIILELKNTPNIPVFKIRKLKLTKNNIYQTINSSIIPKKNKIYFYKIFSYGNDSSTIKKCLEHRINWKSEENKEEGDSTSFIWAPISSQINFYNLAYELRNDIMVNHFEYHNEITNKLNMFRNMMIYCEKKKFKRFKLFTINNINRI